MPLLWSTMFPAVLASPALVGAQILILSLSLAACYSIYRAIYNRYFHPLRGFPGPFWGSISDFFKLWILSTKQAHTLGLKYHAEYGPVVRAAPNLLAINDPLLLPRIYHRRVDKTDVYTPGVLGELAPPFQTIKHDEHAAKRKRVASSVGQAYWQDLQLMPALLILRSSKRASLLIVKSLH